ncbi:hypothetical protein [Actinomadura sp. 9N407]|uniref:hypothetical protein n=1 Tax=Actinomadura sp. 9N407 TaxID=3375154 RepID=UPI0037BBD723
MPVGSGNVPPIPRPPLIAVIAAAVLGLAAVAGGVSAIAYDLTREPTEAEKKTAAKIESSTRWRGLKAAEIFPARFDQRASEESTPGVLWSGVRAGIAPESSCEAAFDAPMAKILAEHGCRATLRATYVDGSGTLVATFGIAVLPDADRAMKAEAALSSKAVKEKYGVRAVSFPGTVTAPFDDHRRQAFDLTSNTTPYLFFRSSGWLADRGDPEQANTVETFRFAETTMQKIMTPFLPGGDVCGKRGVRC